MLARVQPPQLEIRDNRAQSRYELVREDEVIGYATYRLDEDRLVVPYVEVEPRHEGRGYGSMLCAGLLDDARERGLTIVPICPFLAAYIERNANHSDQ